MGRKSAEARKKKWGKKNSFARCGNGVARRQANGNGKQKSRWIGGIYERREMYIPASTTQRA
jgi:hypothetical protein